MQFYLLEMPNKVDIHVEHLKLNGFHDLSFLFWANMQKIWILEVLINFWNLNRGQGLGCEVSAISRGFCAKTARRN